MVDSYIFAVTTFAAVFTIVNPVNAMTFFVVLTRSYADDLKRRVINKAVLSATATLLVFAFVGNYVFALFGTSLPAFQIAGGVLLFSIGFTMMQGERSRTQLTEQDRQEALEKETVGIVPLGIPMFAGPGAITTVMVLMAQASAPLDVTQIGIIVVSVVVTMAVSYLMLLRADAIFARIGRMGAYALTRIMGLILAAIAVQFVIFGIRGAMVQYFGVSVP